VRRIARWGLIFVLAFLVLPAAASAVTRYAAPGGTAAPADCQSPTGPFCSIGAAAGGTGVVAGDEAVVTPGTYSEVGGDLDGDTGTVDNVVEPTAGSVHGAAGQPRPVIVLDSTAGGANSNPYGAFFTGITNLADLEIDTGAGSTAKANLTIVSLTSTTPVVDRVIARSSVANAIVCSQFGGIIRNTACLSSGNGATAVGASSLNGVTNTDNLRGVTAVSTGNNSFGLNYFYAGTGANWTVSAKSVIAQGTQNDVLAHATQNAVLAINLDHSNFDSVNTQTASGGAATVTPAGTGGPNFNVTVPATLAADGYHEVTGSSTINAGATDGLSGTTDIDGQLRQIGLAAPDIGADEFADPASTTVTCAPDPVIVTTATTCTATVTATAEPVSGTVSFASNAAGSFSSTSCTLAGGITTKSCQVNYTPTALGPHQITASYSGDGSHDPGQSTTTVNATTAPTTTTLACSPVSLLVAGSTTCSATVSSIAGGITGDVSFASGAAGAFSAGTCTLAGGTCQVTYTPSMAGSHLITASYGGDTNHDPSQGTTTLTVTAPPPGAGPGGATPGTTKKKCKKKKKKSAASAAKKKCKKKKR